MPEERPKKIRKDAKNKSSAPEASEAMVATGIETATVIATEIALVAETGIAEVETTEVRHAEMMIDVASRAITGEILAL